MYRITAQPCIDLRRKGGRGKTAEFDKVAARKWSGPGRRRCPASARVRPGRALHNTAKRGGRITTALGQFSSSTGAVLLLREVDGLSTKRIADVMDMPGGYGDEPVFRPAADAKLLAARVRRDQITEGGQLGLKYHFVAG